MSSKKAAKWDRVAKKQFGELEDDWQRDWGELRKRVERRATR